MQRRGPVYGAWMARILAPVWNSGVTLVALTMLFWAGSVIVGRAAADLLPPVLFTFLRWTGALILVVPLAWPHLRADLAALWGRRWVVALLAVLSTVAYNILVYRGLHQTTAVNALLMQSVMPLAILLAGLALFNERPGWRQAGAILLSLAGVAVIVAQGSVDTLRHLTFNPGDLLILTAVAAFAVYSAVLRRRPDVHPLSLAAALFAIGVLLLGPLALAEHAAGARAVLSPASVAAVAYAIVFASLLATLCYNRGVALLGAARAGQYSHLQPVFGTVLAVLFLGESLHLYHAAGVAMIGAGLAAAGRGDQPRKETGPA